MFRRSENGTEEKPLEVEYDNGFVYVRENFTFIEAVDNRPAHWEYDEKYITENEYNLEALKNDIAALITLLDMEV